MALPKVRLEKQEAIVMTPEEHKRELLEFLNYAVRNYTLSCDIYKTFWEDDEANCYTDEELYDIYLKER